MEKLIYLDNAATTQVYPEVFEEMKPYFTEYYGNPSSVYQFAQESKNKVERAREEIAEMLKAKWAIGLIGGVLVTNPIPEEYSLDEHEMNEAIDKALILMKEQGIKGKDTTPFLLKTIVELTHGDSLESNIQLVYNNCKLAAHIAEEYVK